ncbi:hypothetical protein [Actinophytocola sp.]|uniref:hypothetical protein n=1 Tax=Actinophytocola sp. TaxID=1872138 RepID=UPI003D6AC5C5
MPTLKRLVSIAAVALFVVLGAAPSAGADVSADQPDSPVSGSPPAPDATGGRGPEADAQVPLLPPAKPPVRPEDPPPDGGVPVWMWIVMALGAGTGVSIAVVLWRGSRPPAGAPAQVESTAELVAVGRRQAPLVGRKPGEYR